MPYAFHKNIKILSTEYPNLYQILERVDRQNPYPKGRKHICWKEQVWINFPILYLASLYIYQLARSNGCDTFIFATRDCSQWHKIFKVLFPDANAHYFHCSRLMFEQATEGTNRYFNEYVRSIVKDVDKTIYLDLHGTALRPIKYFTKHYGKIPFCHLLSVSAKNVDHLSSLGNDWYHRGKLSIGVHSTRGSPIEMLNYDLVGTLQTFDANGPVRDALEYKKSWVEPYHAAIAALLKETPTAAKSFQSKRSMPFTRDLHTDINRLFKLILEEKPCISEKIDHIGKHKPNLELTSSISRAASSVPEGIHFDRILNQSGVYGTIWAGRYQNRDCGIKVVQLTGSGSRRYQRDLKLKGIDWNSDSHKSMDPEAFIQEAENLQRLAELKLAPAVYEVSVQSEKKQWYGIIVMERLDGSIKDILIQRSLYTAEAKIATRLIKKLHRDHNIIHGDLKPSNVGIILDANDRIVKCLFLDCQKVRFDLRSDELARRKERDVSKFKDHYRRNRLIQSTVSARS